MMLLLLVLLLGGATIALLMWLGGAFLQGFFYTEPNAQLYWQAPTAGFAMGAFFALWCFVDLGSGMPPPYDALHRFSPRQDKYPNAVKELTAVKKDGSRIKYRLVREGDKLGVRNTYKDGANREWSSSGVVAIEVPEGNAVIRYEGISDETGGYRRFVSADGWFMQEFNGPTGIPEISRTGRLLGNLLLNGFHLVAWFLSLWLLMRFQWPHALGFAVCLWGLCTLVMLPILLDAAASAGPRTSAISLLLKANRWA
ncbi:MAG: hypothetical protein K2X38_17730 [Gemmataceae bacterium]|nr:hypothetical protein [Gemmataceae bacterium]